MGGLLGPTTQVDCNHYTQGATLDNNDFRLDWVVRGQEIARLSRRLGHARARNRELMKRIDEHVSLMLTREGHWALVAAASRSLELQHKRLIDSMRPVTPVQALLDTLPSYDLQLGQDETWDAHSVRLHNLPAGRYVNLDHLLKKIHEVK